MEPNKMCSKNLKKDKCSAAAKETTADVEDSEASISALFSSDTNTSVCRLDYVPIKEPIDFRCFIRHKFELNDLTDLKIKIGVHVFPYQRSILELHSALFRATRPLQKLLTLPEDYVPTEVLMVIHEWMFDNSARLPRENILRVLVGADYLRMEELIAHIWDYLNSPIITEDRAFLLYLEAIYYKLPTVQSAMIVRVKKFFLTLVGFVQFVNLPFGHVCEMLASDELGVNSELEVFFACVRYLNANWVERKNRTFEMLKNVRFGLLPPPVLVSFRFKKEAPFINQLLEDNKVEKLLSQTMQYVQSLGIAPEGSQMFKQRNWIYDIDCDYHSTNSQAGRIRLTYKTFRNYVHILAKTQTNWQNYVSMDEIEQAFKLRKAQSTDKLPKTTTTSKATLKK